GNAYISGDSDSVDFPLVSAPLTRTAPGAALFVARIAGTGYGIDFNTFVGGGVDSPGLAVDRYGTVYLAGQTVLAGNTARRQSDRSYGASLARVGSSAAVPTVPGLEGNPTALGNQAGAPAPPSALSSTEPISTSQVFGAAVSVGVGTSPASVAA